MVANVPCGLADSCARGTVAVVPSSGKDGRWLKCMSEARKPSELSFKHWTGNHVLSRGLLRRVCSRHACGEP